MPNNFAIAADTSSPAAAATDVVADDATACAALNAEPIRPTPADADTNASGDVTTNDITVSLSAARNGVTPMPRIVTCPNTEFSS